MTLGSVNAIMLASLAILRHRSFHSFGLDLGLFDQIVWNTTQGRPLESTMSLAIATPHSLLGDHFSPILLPFSLIYAIYPHPETLLVMQSVGLALGAWPAYLLARFKLGRGFGLLWTGVFALFIPAAYINLYDFHEVALSVVPFGFALYFLERRQRWWFLLCLGVALLIKEDMAIVAFGFGAYAWLGKRDWVTGQAVLVGSVLTSLLIVGVVIPYFAGSHAYEYVAERYGYIGGTPGGILKTLFSDPLRIGRALLVPKKVYFMFAIFAPVLGLSAIAGWASLVLLPTLAYLLLTNYVPQFSFATQYAAPLIPLVIGTAIIGMARIPRRFQVKAAGAVLASSLVMSWAFGYLPFSRKFDPSVFEAQSRYAAFVPALNQIPAGASVSAEDGLASHLSERRFIYDYGFQGIQNADWLVLDYAAINYNVAGFQAQLAQADSQGYIVVAEGEGLALLRKS